MASHNVQYPWLSSVNVSNFVPTKLWFNNTSTNYLIWKEQILCLIQSQGLTGFIDGSITPPPFTVAAGTFYDNVAEINQEYYRWKSTDSLIKGWILGSLTDPVASIVLYSATARELCLELENRFHQFNAHLQLQLQHQPQLQPEPEPQPQTDMNAEQSIPEKDLNDYLPLYRAALRGDWEAAKRIFDQDPASIHIKHVMAFALHAATGTGKAIYFVENMTQLLPDESLKQGDAFGNTALNVAASVGNTEAAIVLIKRMPSLLYIPNNGGDFPVQLAAEFGQINTLKYLISVTRDDAEKNPFEGISGVKLLELVIEAEFFDVALYLVDKYPHTARMKLPSGDSALSRISIKKSAFSSGLHFNFWEHFFVRLFQHSPAMLWKWIERLVPFQVKIIKDKYVRSEQALQLVKRMCEKMESMRHYEAWDISRDAVILAAQFGTPEVVEVIVETFPPALYSRSPDSNQYMFHAAIENRSEEVFNLTYRMSDHKHVYPSLVDSNKNNLLHLAGKLAPPHKLNKVCGAALQMQRELQWYKEVEKFMPPCYKEQGNKAGKSPQMVFTEEHKELKEAGEKWMKDTANSFTIAAALIATVMFAAAITVPGGNDDKNGFPIFATDTAFIVFAVSDAISLFTSITSLLMFLSILTSRYAEEDFLVVLPKRLIIGLSTLFVSITFMMVAFGATLLLLFGRKNVWVLIPVAALACLPVTLFVLLQFQLLVELVYSTYCPGIFGKKSNRPFY